MTSNDELDFSYANTISINATKVKNGRIIEWSVSFLENENYIGIIKKLDDIFIYQDDTGSQIHDSDFDDVIEGIRVLFSTATRH